MAKIDTSKIEGYDKMTPEEKLKALEAFEYEDNSDELGKSKDEIERLKSAVSKANSEAKGYKDKLNSKLTEEEAKKQADEEKLADLQKQVETLQKEKTVSTYKASYLAMGYDEKLAEETAQALADGDTAKVFANSQKFLKTHDETLKADILKGTPKPAEGGGAKTVTKEQFEAMGYMEMLELKQNNPELYAELSGDNPENNE